MRSDPVAAARAVAAGAARRAGCHDHDGGFPAEDVAELARMGLLAAPVPRREGGAGLGEEPDGAILQAVLTHVGAGSLALGRVYEGHVNAVQLVAQGDRLKGMDFGVAFCVIHRAPRSGEAS
ncbi:acyl-CoA dehydrogenase family protein, partial [Methylobacterium mesophilicum]